MQPPSSERARKEDPPSSLQRARLARVRHFFHHAIWKAAPEGESAFRNQARALLRVLALSARGLTENRLFSRAAALSYASLIALGPLIAIIVILSGSFIQTDARTQIKRGLLFIAPSLQEMVRLDEGEASSERASAIDDLINQIVTGAEDLLNRVNTGGSKAFGTLGGLIFVWVVIQLLTSVENTLNQIWGVHKGRRWSQRIVFYWTFISLGVLLGLGSTALLSASNLVGMTDWMPFGSDIARPLLALSPLLSFIMLVLLLTLFYRFFPNTSVNFRPAFVGSLITAGLLILNNYLSILYVHRVISFQSLYGSVGIIPVLMIGLYFFWILILLGGQLTYALQNVSFLTTKSAWLGISPFVRKALTLASFLFIARKFHQCLPPPSINAISSHLHVPTNLLNESVSILEKLGWITRVSLEDADDESERTAFRPSRPLTSYTFSHFQKDFENLGQSDLQDSLLQSDPLLQRYRESLREQGETPFWKSSLAELLSQEGSPAART
ncbi:MAG TPA: YihY/virulence factor BrkB family protein [Oceanipulchritudo sp.]|nr:YihY/virulence factor BrkB family protein [Oceanipulchritudo sp.]